MKQGRRRAKHRRVTSPNRGRSKSNDRDLVAMAGSQDTVIQDGVDIADDGGVDVTDDGGVDVADDGGVDVAEDGEEKDGAEHGKKPDPHQGADGPTPWT